MARLRCNQVSVSISNPKRLKMDNLIALHNDKRRAWNPKLFHSGTNVIVNRIKIGRRGLGKGWLDSGYGRDRSQNRYT
jgi:hypothetical protein